MGLAQLSPFQVKNHMDRARPIISWFSNGSTEYWWFDDGLTQYVAVGLFMPCPLGRGRESPPSRLDVEIGSLFSG